MEDCIFCKIIRKDIPASIVYEDKDTLAFLDIKPAARGHTLVIPKKHAETIDSLDDDSAKKLMLTIKKVGKVMGSFSDGYNVVENNGEVAGQAVNHVHFHIVPRKRGDGLHAGFGKHVEYKTDEEKSGWVERLKNGLKA